MMNENHFRRTVIYKFVKLLCICIFSVILFLNNVYADDVNAKIKLEREMMKTRENTYIVKYNNEGIRAVYSDDVPKSMASDIKVVHIDDIKKLEKLKEDGTIIYIEENRKLHILNNIPNDPYYPEQWGLHWIMAAETWDLIVGSIQKKPITVAVIDTGADLNHEDLRGRIAEGGYNFILDNGDTYDLNGHGTSVSGTIAAVTNNGKGIAGVAGNLEIKILPLQTADAGGNSYSSDVIRAIEYATEKNVDIINLSFGSQKPSQTENDVIQKAIDKGIIVVAAGGNNKNGVYMYPASYDNVISVGSISQDGNISYFSNVNDKIDIFAPGMKIYTTSKNNSYVYESGTSFSAPIVSGVVAALLALDPLLNLQNIKNLFNTSSDKIEFIDGVQTSYNSLNFYKAVNQIVPARSAASISIKDDTTKLLTGHRKQLKYEILPVDFEDKNVYWTSDNPSVATVDKNGLVTAVDEGIATITATIGDGGKADTISINVLKVDKNWETFAEPVTPKRIWNIKFNKKIDSDSIDDSIYIFDDYGNQVDIDIEYDKGRDEGNIITIRTQNPYTSKERYYLFISDKILSDGGLRLSETVLMEFTIE